MLKSTRVPETGTNFIPKLFVQGCSLLASWSRGSGALGTTSGSPSGGGPSISPEDVGLATGLAAKILEVSRQIAAKTVKPIKAARRIVRAISSALRFAGGKGYHPACCSATV